MDQIAIRGPEHRRRRWKLVLAPVAVLAVALALSACGSNSSGAKAGATLTIADFSPFSGANSDYGYLEQTGCEAALHFINAGGGAGGHKLSCLIVDSRGDPADAVPAAQKMLATTSNLVAVVDQNSGLLTATVPLFDSSHIPDLSLGGDIPFDHNHYQYFWRTIPGDDIAGDALAAYVALKTPYRTIAAVFGNDQAAQGNVPGLLNGAKNLGLKVTINEPLAIDSTTYETEIQRLKSSNPQVFASETDPQTAGVFLGELKQAGINIPGVLTSGTLLPNWDRAAIAAIGAASFKKNFVRVMLYAPSSGPAYQTWIQGLDAIKNTVRDAGKDAQQFYSEAPYDNVNEVALAIQASHSTDPSVINNWIPKITQGTTVVHTFAEGKAALVAGKTIDYVGVTGQVHFNQYHNNAGVWAAQQPLTSKVISILSPTDVERAVGH
ncbi:MAG TPA: ABC transporter substrate-binding protein [Solirubrobacteraceae bacterium]|nr:ABC transporter substrate-binding protein [Solirubrobacteraceae bacterium]